MTLDLKINSYFSSLLCKMLKNPGKLLARTKRTQLNSVALALSPSRLLPHSTLLQWMQNLLWRKKNHESWALIRCCTNASISPSLIQETFTEQLPPAMGKQAEQRQQARFLLSQLLGEKEHSQEINKFLGNFRQWQMLWRKYNWKMRHHLNLLIILRDNDLPIYRFWEVFSRKSVEVNCINGSE